MNMFKNIDPDTARRWLLVPGDWRRPAAGERYEILWDGDRSYGQVWPRPPLSDLRAHYEVEQYYTHAADLAPASRPPGLLQRLQTKISWLADKGIEPDRSWWLRILGDRRPLRILEIGCGSGAGLSTLRALGHCVVGVEPDPAARAVARDAGHEVHEGTAEDLPPQVAGDRFDLVIFMHVLEHCLDPFEAMTNAVHVLKAGGTVVAEVPNNDCRGAGRFGMTWYWLDAPRHLNFFTVRSLNELFSAAALQVEEVSFQGYCRQFSAEWKEAQDRIATNLGLRDDQHPAERDYWLYLAETIRAADRKKYDSVRLVGRYR